MTQAEVNRMFADTFLTPAGKKALEWLHSSTIETPAINHCPTNAVEAPTDEVYYLFWHEGRSSLVREIEAAIQAAQEGR